MCPIVDFAEDRAAAKQSACRKFELAHVAHAVQLPENTIREWLDDPELPLMFMNVERGWFDLADIACLILMRKLQVCGAGGPQVTAIIASSILATRVEDLCHHRGGSPEDFVSAFADAMCFQWRDGDEIRGELVFSGLEEGLPDDTCAVIDVQATLHNAFRRAVEAYDSERSASWQYGWQHQGTATLQ